MAGSSNAVLAKSRAIYGKRLKSSDYDNLMNCRSINEIVSYLKSNTAYSAAFESANSDMSSFQVEELLKIDVLKTFEKVSRYENSPRREYYTYYIIKSDIEQIMQFIHCLSIGKPQSYLEVMPPFFNKHSDVDLLRLAGARSFEEMLDALKNTAYHDALKPYAHVFSDPESYIKIENSLDKILWEKEKQIVDRYIGREKKLVEKMLSFRHDMDNLVRIYRLKRFGIIDETSAADYINPYYSAIGKKELNALLGKSTAAEMITVFSDSLYKKHFKNTEFISIEDSTRRAVYSVYSHELRYSTDPVVVMLCFFFLKENEVNNIIHITEGIRNGVSPEVIKSVLIL